MGILRQKVSIHRIAKGVGIQEWNTMTAEYTATIINYNESIALSRNQIHEW